jgi:hypothetical protein
LHGIARGGVDDIGGAKLPGSGELVLEQVDGDDLRGASEGSALDDVEADAARPDDGHSGADVHLRGVRDGADAGHDAAADERGHVHGDVVGDVDEGVLMDELALRERRHVGELQHGVAVELDAPHAAERLAVVAEVGLADGAEVARAAGRHKGDHHAVARLDACDIAADLLDDAGGFVAEDDGRRIGV